MKKEKFKSDYQFLCWQAFKATGNPYVAQDMIGENEKIAGHIKEGRERG